MIANIVMFNDKKYVIKLRTLIDICMNEISVILILSFFFGFFFVLLYFI